MKINILLLVYHINLLTSF